jgi:hypothetical protein
MTHTKFVYLASAFALLCVTCLIIGGSFLWVAASSVPANKVANSVNLPADITPTASTTTVPVVEPSPTPTDTPVEQPSPTPTDTPVTQPTPTPTPVPSTHSTVSPLLFGTNLNLWDSHDQVLSSAATQAMLQQMHVKMVRIPTRSNLTEATIVQAAQIVKNIGAVPLIILMRRETNPNALLDDTRVIMAMNRVFGNSVVYYEYGNEADLGNGDPRPYIASWNALVPLLKQAATNGRFVGPATYLYDFNYLRDFLKGAQPLPDAVSWHEYTCGATWAADVCLSHIDNWSKHIANARGIMQAAVGRQFPIMITEWNYTAEHQVAGDGKNDNPSFMTAWTTKAFQVLAANNVFAAMQYVCTNGQVPLIATDNTMTPQGMAFQAQYNSMIGPS